VKKETNGSESKVFEPLWFGLVAIASSILAQTFYQNSLFFLPYYFGVKTMCTKKQTEKIQICGC